MFGAFFRIVLYNVIIVFPVIWVTVFGVVTEGFVYELGRNAALAGFMIIFFQVLLAARIKWMERAFGLDILIRFHKYMAIAAAVLLLLHPVLLATGSGKLDLLFSLDQSWIIWLGKIALVLLLINAGVSIYQRKLNLKFERWRQVHDILGPVIILFIFIHSAIVGVDLQQPFMRGLWIVLFVVAVLVFLWHRIMRPLYLKRNPWRVIDVQQEAPTVWTVKLAPPQGKPIFEYAPGQFQFITFFRDPSLPVEEHHWTISSSPAEKNYVSSTIKTLGDFTATIKDTRPGDTAAVHGPFGRFSHALHPKENDLVFLAGGIGITPLMSMLRHMRDTKDTRSVLLLYGNPDTRDIVFREELGAIESGGNPRLRIVHVLSDPAEDWTGERGIIDADKIARYCGSDLSGKTFYVCGPPPLIKGVISALGQMGVSHRQIRVEVFSFID